MRHLDKLNTPLILTYGTYETPEFQRQSRDFAAAVKAAGKPVELLVGEGYNHFEMLETLANPYGLFGRAVLTQMKLMQAFSQPHPPPPGSEIRPPRAAACRALSSCTPRCE